MWKERLLSQEHHNDVNRFSAMVNLFFIIPGHPGGVPCRDSGLHASTSGIHAFAKALAGKTGTVTALHIGRGGGAGNSLEKAFNGAAATPVDYTGYRDSKGMQSQVWKSKAYKP